MDVMLQEQADVLALVPDSLATHRAVQSGPWSSAATWDNGVPGAGACVVVPTGIAVAFDAASTARLRFIRVDGMMSFVVDADLSLLLETWIVNLGGVLTMGTLVNPLTGQVNVTFLDSGKLDVVYDPHQYSRGLISLGVVSIAGKPWMPTLPPRDLVGSVYYQFADSLDALCNVCFGSENELPTRAGHIMMMHSNQVAVDSACFKGLSRTDKRIPIGTFNADSLPNPRGRYGLHFHRDGIDITSTPIPVTRCLFSGGYGWGLVNHSSYVVADSCVAKDTLGALFVSEAGNEIGSFTNCLGVRSVGSGQAASIRNNVMDFGHNGAGFWMESPGVKVNNCIAGGCGKNGQGTNFAIYSLGLNEAGLGTCRFLVANLPDPSIGAGHVYVPVEDVQQFGFDNNYSFDRRGLDHFFWHVNLGRLKDTQQSFINSFHGGPGNGDSVALQYSFLTTLNDLVIRGNGTGKGVSNIFGYGGDETLVNPNITGFSTGIVTPSKKSFTLQGGFIDALTAVTVQQIDSDEPPRVINFDGLTKFGASTVEQYHLVAGFNTQGGRKVWPMLYRDTIFFGTDQQLYWADQLVDNIPFPSMLNPGWWPIELLDKTQAQLYADLGLALHGQAAHPDAVPMPASNAYIGPAQPVLPTITLASGQVVSIANPYTLKWNDSGHIITDSLSPLTLRLGWQVLTRQIHGANRSFLVQGTP